MFSVKKKPYNGKQKIDFKVYVKNEVILDLPDNVINFIYDQLQTKTIEECMDNFIPILNKVEKEFPGIDDDYLRIHNVGSFMFEVMEDLTKEIE